MKDVTTNDEKWALLDKMYSEANDKRSLGYSVMSVIDGEFTVLSKCKTLDEACKIRETLEANTKDVILIIPNRELDPKCAVFFTHDAVTKVQMCKPTTHKNCVLLMEYLDKLIDSWDGTFFIEPIEEE